MSVKSRWVVGALVFGLAGSAVAYLGSDASTHRRDRNEAAAKESAATDRADQGQDVERLRAELALLRGELNHLRDRESEQKAPEAAEHPATEAEEVDPQKLRAEREEADRQWKDHMAEVAMDFEQETVDRTFATKATTAVEQELQNNPVIQAAAGKVECRTHTCRLEIRDARNSEVSKQLQMFVHKLGPTLPRAQADQVQDANGQTNLVLYMTDQEPVAQGPNK
jgi:hypothetical protein